MSSKITRDQAVPSTAGSPREQVGATRQAPRVDLPKSSAPAEGPPTGGKQSAKKARRAARRKALRSPSGPVSPVVSKRPQARTIARASPVTPASKKLRPARVAGSAPSPIESVAGRSGLSLSSGGVLAPKSARNLRFPTPMRSPVPPRTFRPVSPDLPYSLVTGERAGLISQGFKDPAEVVAALSSYSSLVDTEDPRQHELSPRLRGAGLLPSKVSPFTTLQPQYAVKKSTMAPEASADPDAPGPSGTGVPSSAEEGALETPEDDSEDEPLEESDMVYDRERLDKLIRKELPQVADLDDTLSIQYFCTRYEVVCGRLNADVNYHVALIEACLQQSQTLKFQEKTRLWAVTHYAQQARCETGDLDYAAFKAVLVKVAGGEQPMYTRKSLSSLSQKSCGSFAQYLSDFETQAAYVNPSDAERLELFQAGLIQSLKNRVLLRSDGTEWTSWFEFLTVCKRFADAEARSRDLPVKALETVAAATTAAAKKRQQASSSSAPSSQRQKKKAKKEATAAAAGASASAYGQAQTSVIKKWCTDRQLCYNCLEPRHTEQLKKDATTGKMRCTRPRVKGDTKWGQTLANAVQAELKAQSSQRS